MIEENNLGCNAFGTCTVDNDQNRLKTFLVDTHMFNEKDFDQDLRTSLHSELFNPLKNNSPGRMTEEALQTHLALNSFQNSFSPNKTLELVTPNSENNRYSLDKVAEQLNKTTGISNDSIQKYLTTKNSDPSSFKHRYDDYLERYMSNMDKQSQVDNHTQASNFTITSRPERLRAFMDRNRKTVMNNLDEISNKNDKQVIQSLENFKMRSSALKRFEHNLLLPAKNPRELTKLQNLDKNKFAEIFKNRYKLDNFNLRANRNTPTIRNNTIRIDNNEYNKIVETKTNSSENNQNTSLRNSPTKLEKLHPTIKRSSVPSKHAEILSLKTIQKPRKSILKPLANIRKEVRASPPEMPEPKTVSIYETKAKAIDLLPSKISKNEQIADRYKTYSQSLSSSLNRTLNSPLKKGLKQTQNEAPTIVEQTKTDFADDIGNVGTGVSFMPKQPKKTVGYTIQATDPQSNILKSKSATMFNERKDRNLVRK